MVIPPPMPATEDWHFMLYELSYLSMRKSHPHADPEVNSHDHDVRKLARLLEAFRRRDPVNKEEIALIKKVWKRFEHQLSPTERAVNPPVGHPSYRWPEGTTILPMEMFMAPWAVESHRKGSFYPAELMAAPK